jgi:catalase
MVRIAYTLRAEDDDWGQAGALVRDVMNDVERNRLVDTVVGHLRAGVSEPVLQRAFDYWRNTDTDIGDRIEKGSDCEPPPSPGHGPAANHVR